MCFQRGVWDDRLLVQHLAGSGIGMEMCYECTVCLDDNDSNRHETQFDHYFLVPVINTGDSTSTLSSGDAVIVDSGE